MIFFRATCAMFIAAGLIIAFGAIIAMRTVINFYLATGPQAANSLYSFIGPLLAFNMVVTAVAAANAIITGVIGLRYRHPAGKTMLICLGALNILTMPIGMIFANIVLNVHVDWWRPGSMFLHMVVACVAIPILFLICVIIRIIAEGNNG